jgi:hypothetical protein
VAKAQYSLGDAKERGSKAKKHTLDNIFVQNPLFRSGF